ncbi:hypothetical protein [Porphyromonas gingivalis]|nr:hypothetical protein [Porphyromonas gingivalis]
MAKILVAFNTVSEGFDRLTARHKVVFPPKGDLCKIRRWSKEEFLA